MSQIEISTLDRHQGLEKTKRYGWVMKDAPGKLEMLSKSVLRVHSDYQRELNVPKARQIASAWSWIGCGVLVVALRDGSFWVIDGQHRLWGALYRSDIDLLPCVVFETDDVQQEARGFLDLNTGRKPIGSLDRHKAQLAAKEPVAVLVAKTFNAMGLTMKKRATKPGDIEAVSWCTKRASENAVAFVVVLTLAHVLSRADGLVIKERLLEGLWFLNLRCESGLQDRRLRNRLHAKGASALLDAANRAAVFYVSGGGLVWAKGMLAELNKGLTHKFVMREAD